MTTDELKQKFLSDWDRPSVGYIGEPGNHKPDPESGMARALDALLTLVTSTLRRELETTKRSEAALQLLATTAGQLLHAEEYKNHELQHELEEVRKAGLEGLQREDFIRLELGKYRVQHDVLLEAAKAEAVVAYQNRLSVLRHGRIQDYEEFTRLREVVRSQLVANGES